MGRASSFNATTVVLVLASCWPASRADGESAAAKKTENQPQAKVSAPTAAAAGGSAAAGGAARGAAQQVVPPSLLLGWDEIAMLLAGDKTGWACEPVDEEGWEDVEDCYRCRWDEWKAANGTKAKRSKQEVSAFPFPCADVLRRGPKLDSFVFFIADDDFGALATLKHRWGAPSVTTPRAQCWRQGSWSAGFVEDELGKFLRVKPIRENTTQDECGPLGTASASHRACVETQAKYLSKRMPGVYTAEDLIEAAKQFCTFNEKAKREGQRRDQDIDRLLRRSAP